VSSHDLAYREPEKIRSIDAEPEAIALRATAVAPAS
jgi:hypothetical protein